MIFFNLTALETQACNKPNMFMAMLEYHYTKALPNKYSKFKPAKVSLAGNSYLINPEELFNDKSTDVLYKLQYVKLAARRDYMLYKQYKYKALQTSYFPDLLVDVIRSNPLLEITPTEVHFKYE
jgi:hypothetical protein